MQAKFGPGEEIHAVLLLVLLCVAMTSSWSFSLCKSKFPFAPLEGQSAAPSKCLHELQVFPRPITDLMSWVHLACEASVWENERSRVSHYFTALLSACLKISLLVTCRAGYDLSQEAVRFGANTEKAQKLGVKFKPLESQLVDVVKSLHQYGYLENLHKNWVLHREWSTRFLDEVGSQTGIV